MSSEGFSKIKIAKQIKSSWGNLTHNQRISLFAIAVIAVVSIPLTTWTALQQQRLRSEASEPTSSMIPGGSPFGKALSLDKAFFYSEEAHQIQPLSKATFEMWILPLEFDMGIIGKVYDPKNESIIYELSINAEGYLSFSYSGLKDNQWAIQTAASKSRISLNQWQHIAMTFDGSYIKFYINGQRAGMVEARHDQLGYQGSDIPENGLILGNYTKQPIFENAMFNGYIDEVRMSDIVRYNDSFSPLRSPFSADDHTLVLYHMENNTEDSSVPPYDAPFYSGSYSYVTSATFSEEPSLYFGEPRLNANYNYEVDLKMDTAGQPLAGVKTVVNYNPSLLEYLSSYNFNSEIQFNSQQTTNGQHILSGDIGTDPDAEPISGNNITVATLTFRPLEENATARLEYDFEFGNRNDSNLVLYKKDYFLEDPTDILSRVLPLEITMGTPTSTPMPSPNPTRYLTPTPVGVSPTPTITPTPQPVRMSFIVRAQGRLRVDVSKLLSNLELTIDRQDSAEPKTITINTESEGQFSLTDIPSGDYRFMIDKPGYLARRYPSEGYINVNKNYGYLDLTNYPLLGGDFTEDGQINSLDYALFREKFGSSDEIIDLDFSGQVNNLDFAIMRSNWSLTDDEITQP